MNLRSEFLSTSSLPGLSRSPVLLSVLSGVMLGFSFPPSEYGILACFGLIPLLVVLSNIKNIIPSLKYTYIAFLTFHLITLNWTGGYSHGNDPYMMIAGAVTMTVHPLFYFIPMVAYGFVKKYLGEPNALLSLPFLWIGYEYTHTLSEWSFPWLTLGNSQSYDITRIQFITWTGVYGLSFLLLILNVVGYLLLREAHKAAGQERNRRLFLLLAVLTIVYVSPTIHGLLVLPRGDEHAAPQSGEPRDSITVGIIQSNIDPWEKWTKGGFDSMELYLKMTRDLLSNQNIPKPDLVLWPETSIPYYILTDANLPRLRYLREEIDAIGVPVLFGFPHAVFYEDSSTAPPSSKRIQSTGQRYDAFNAATFLQPGVAAMSWYGKMKMVPIAERVPYADAFYFMDFLRWGVGIGGWQIGRDTVIFQEKKSGSRFNTAICYESVYPGFIASFVKKGAEFICIITIDSWWGRMSGAFQHHQYAIFRAVENRRWIARCAVGGISSYIDPYGRVFAKTELFTQATLSRTIFCSRELTPYTEHGDLFSQGCLFVGGMFIAAAAGQRFKQRKREEV